MLVNLSIPIMQLKVVFVRSAVLVNPSKHQLLLSCLLQLEIICSSPFKPVSNFISGCQFIKPVSKRIDVNRKRPRERFPDKKSSGQREFTKPFSAVNFLMMSIYFYELVLLFFCISSQLAFHFYISCLYFSNNNVDNFSNTMSGVIIFLKMSF